MKTGESQFFHLQILKRQTPYINNKAAKGIKRSKA
jgi:hypothetical protein